MRFSAAILPLLLLASASQAEFQRCLEELQQQARQSGLSAATAELIPTLNYQGKVIEYDRKQPEFTTPFSDYLGRRVTDQRILRGRVLLQEQAPLLTRLSREYGIPAQYLVAFWGLETNYGSYLGKMPTLDSLATLACDPRRSDFFTEQLFNALRIVEREGITPEQMRGSWAGAIGHTQFMPSVYLRYAVDGDGDGQIDLWRSVEDALTSAAAFLQGLGWQRDQRWGREVQLPATFDYRLLDSRQSLAEWRDSGIRQASGAALPALDMPARLVLPAGHRGPAFLVYRNFDVIMGWNRSEFYAIAVGHLADRINGAGRLATAPPPDDRRFSLDEMREIQQQLAANGFDPGDADGILGPATRRAIREFQRAHGMIPDGYPGQQLLDKLAGADS